MTDVPSRARSGVRLEGDDYQHLVTLNEVFRALIPRSDVTTVTVEAPDTGNMDDIVIEHAAAPTEYLQVKHAVDPTTPVGASWLTATPGGSRSLLRRFYETWRTLGGSTKRPHMQLVTDREIDSRDPIMKLLDRRTELVMPMLSDDTAPRAAQERATEWAKHLGVDEGELLEMLRDLRFRTGRPMNGERERLEAFLWGAGYRCDQTAVDAGIGMVRRWVQERWRTLTIDELGDRVAATFQQAETPSALLIIEAIDDDPHPEDATELLRWVELYDGDDANSRRQLSMPSNWQDVIDPELDRAAARLRQSGVTRVVVRGALRLPLWFAAGAALRHVHGFDVGAIQHGAVWASDDATSTLAPNVTAHDSGAGSDLAIGVAIATDLTQSVLRYINDAAISAARLVVVSTPGGPGGESIDDGSAAAKLAVGIRDAVRLELEVHPASRIHLFIAAPGGLALLLGHRWNALRPTIVYEHLGPGLGYAPTIEVRS